MAAGSRRGRRPGDRLAGGEGLGGDHGSELAAELKAVSEEIGAKVVEAEFAADDLAVVTVIRQAEAALWLANTDCTY